MSPKLRRILIVAIAVVGGIAVAALFATLLSEDEDVDLEDPDDHIVEVDEDEQYEDVIHTPPAMGELKTSIRDIDGDPVGIKCSTCHTEGNIGDPPADTAGELTEFHTEMEFGHGDLTCSSCHATDDRDKLKLADDTRIDFEETIDQCAQCHSSEYRSFRHGAHGGASGYWDRTEGPRERNHCVVCHDPHDPSFPSVMPADPPRDRFFGDQQ